MTLFSSVPPTFGGRTNRCFAPLLVLLILNLAVHAEESPVYIEEVLVTAEKRTENLQDLSQAVSVFDEEMLLRTAATSIIDLDGLVPGVNIAKNEGIKTILTIRGVGNEANQNAIANPSVSYHLDGIYVASTFSLQSDFLDLAQVEVIRGPQGTLFGQNSTGGAVSVSTAKPDPTHLFGRLQTSLGSYDRFKTLASINVPLSERLAIRSSASWNKHAGFAQNVVLEQELDDADGKAGRVSLLWDATTDLDVLVSYFHYSEDINGAAQKGIRDITPGPRRLAQDSLSEYNLQSRLSYSVISWDHAAFTLKSLTSRQNDEVFILRDNDRHTLLDARSPIPTPAFILDHDQLKAFTQEFQLISNESYFDRVDWVAGVFYVNNSVVLHFNEQIDFGHDGMFDPVTVEQVRNFELGDYGFISNSKVARKSLSAYFQSTYELTASQRLIGGLRYTDDQVRGQVTNFFGRAGTSHLATNTQRITGRSAYEIDLNEATLLFGSFTRGFKPGGSNLTFGREDVIAPILVLPTFEEEVVDVMELGLKSDLLQNRLRLNVALFAYTYENLQYQATDPEVFEGGVANVPESDISGIELESQLFVTDAIAMDFTLAWLDTSISAHHLSLDNVASDTVTNQLLANGNSLFGPEIQRARANQIKDVVGNQLPKVPNLNAVIRLEVVRELPGWGELNWTLQLRHRGEFYYRLFNNPVTDRIEAYQQVDSFLQLRSQGNWQINLHMLNLLDEVGINSRFTDSFGVGSTSDELIPPRQLWLGVGYDF